eukprot:354565-Chlamydomonas_euryale.AAC.7
MEPPAAAAAVLVSRRSHSMTAAAAAAASQLAHAAGQARTVTAACDSSLKHAAAVLVHFVWQGSLGRCGCCCLEGRRLLPALQQVLRGAAACGCSCAVSGPLLLFGDLQRHRSIDPPKTFMSRCMYAVTPYPHNSQDHTKCR